MTFYSVIGLVNKSLFFGVSMYTSTMLAALNTDLNPVCLIGYLAAFLVSFAISFS
jgi:hypothetical protein